MTSIGLLIFVFVSPARELWAQVTWIPIPVCGDDWAKVENQLKTETDPQYVLRVGAIDGEKSIPVLRTLSKPRRPLFTVPGAAQVALARLDDRQTLDELQAEVQGKQGIFVIQAVDKLAYVRTNASVAILMQYLARNELNAKRAIDSGDVIDDPMQHVVNALIAMVVILPLDFR